MKNKLIDLNNHLFMQLERLGDENMDADALDREVKRSEAIVAVSTQIIQTADTTLKAAKLVADHGAYVGRFLPMLDSKPLIEGKPE